MSKAAALELKRDKTRKKIFTRSYSTLVSTLNYQIHRSIWFVFYFFCY